MEGGRSIKYWWLDEVPPETSQNARDRVDKLVRRVLRVVPSARRLSPEDAIEAWKKLKQRLIKAGKWDHDNHYLWDNFTKADETKFPVLPVAGDVVILMELYPTAALVAEDVSSFREHQSFMPDLYLLPWPRLNTVTVITHELGIGPYYIDFRG